VRYLTWLIERQFEEAVNVGAADDSDSMKSRTICTSLSSSKLPIPSKFEQENLMKSLSWFFFGYWVLESLAL